MPLADIGCPGPREWGAGPPCQKLGGARVCLSGLWEPPLLSSPFCWRPLPGVMPHTLSGPCLHTGPAGLALAAACEQLVTHQPLCAQLSSPNSPEKKRLRPLCSRRKLRLPQMPSMWWEAVLEQSGKQGGSLPLSPAHVPATEDLRWWALVRVLREAPSCWTHTHTHSQTKQTVTHAATTRGGTP